MLEQKKTYITGALIMLVAIAKTILDYLGTGHFQPMVYAEEFLAGVGLIFLRKGIKQDTKEVKQEVKAAKVEVKAEVAEVAEAAKA